MNHEFNKLIFKLNKITAESTLDFKNHGRYRRDFIRKIRFQALRSDVTSKDLIIGRRMVIIKME